MPRAPGDVHPGGVDCAGVQLPSWVKQPQVTIRINSRMCWEIGQLNPLKSEGISETNYREGIKKWKNTLQSSSTKRSRLFYRKHISKATVSSARANSSPHQPHPSCKPLHMEKTTPNVG